MDLRPLSEDHSVAPQLEPGDMAQLARAAVRLVICNRPDAEVPPALIWAFAQAGRQETDAIIAAGNAAGYPMDGLRAQIEALAARG